MEAVSAAPSIAGSAVVAYFLAQRFTRSIPPVLAALVVGLVASLVTGSIKPAAVDLGFVLPQFTMPVFTLAAFFGVAVPLAALVIGAENAQAIGVLMAEDYKPPINAMTVISGVGGILAGMMGGHNANIAGPMTAICSSEQAGDDRSKRYGASVVNGVLFGAFGLFAGLAVPLVLALPKPLIGVVAGLAMIGVLLSALQAGFETKQGYQVGAFVALVVAMSPLNLFGVSAPFWSLVFGVAVAMLVDGVPPVSRTVER